MFQLIGKFLVGVDAKNPVVGSEAVGEVFLFGIAQPFLFYELHVELFTDFFGFVG